MGTYAALALTCVNPESFVEALAQSHAVPGDSVVA